MCKQYAGFRRVCITDPAPERKFFRRGWVTFDHSVQIRNICYELNSTKVIFNVTFVHMLSFFVYLVTRSGYRSYYQS